MTLNTIVTIGAGQTAAVAARTLRRRGFDGRILLVGDEPHAPYQRPPLSKEFLAGQEDRESLMLLPDAWREKQNVELLTGTTVTRIDPSGGSVDLSDGRSIAADAVLVATGGRPRTMPVNGPASERVHYLRTIDDAERLAAHLRPGIGLVLIGGGFVGLEIAATAQALGAEVTVLEADAVPLARILGAEMGDVCTRLQRENGVTVRAGVRVDTVTTRSDGVLIALQGGEVLQADVVVVGIGIVPQRRGRTGLRTGRRRRDPRGCTGADIDSTRLRRRRRGSAILRRGRQARSRRTLRQREQAGGGDREPHARTRRGGGPPRTGSGPTSSARTSSSPAPPATPTWSSAAAPTAASSPPSIWTAVLCAAPSHSTAATRSARPEN